ncbi:hypothetical protein SS50377_27521 [Spironucleus salmonicida]|uniref:Uncharacterized protein n=1 Tax=Spironucleus salmonicida TaxID=348837 RepID=V6LT66_9EUKA|nr:hypothetical protein SS50377_27521 [Spironucleus salmonicida]|eukprot:EST46886.1 Hypothetical protein SS50377_13039 [Spironucleus salmonicida]
MYASNNYIENELYQNFLLAQISASELQNHLSSSNYNPDIVLTQFGSLLSPEFIKSTMYHSQNSALSESAIDSLQLIYSKDVIKLSKILLVHPENLICDGEVSQIQVTLEIEKLSKQGRKIDVLALLTIQESQSNLLDIVKLVIQYNLKDTQQDDNLEMFQGDSEYLTKSVKSSGWDSSSEADSVWKSDEEEQQQQSVEGWSDDDDESQKTEPNQPPENQLTEIKFYKGKKNYQNLSVQTQIFIFKILQDQPQLTTDISLTQLSLPLILSLQPDLCEKYIPQAIFQLIPQSQPINQLFEYAELLFQANLNQLSFLQFFSPFLAVSYEFRPETALEAFIVSNNINSNETIQNNAQLFVDFFKLYKIQLFDDAKYNILRQEKHAMKTAIQRYFDDDFDCGVVLFGGFQPQIQDLVQVMFLDKEDREIDFQGLIMQDLVGFSIQNQIKIAFVMQKLCSEQEIIDILYRGIDELQPVSLYKQAHLILQLKQLKKLPSVIQDKIQEEVNFLVQMSSSYKILHKSAVFEVVDMGQVTINLQYLGLGKNKKFKEIDGLQWGIEMGDGIVAIKFYENGQIGKSVLFK